MTVKQLMNKLKRIPNEYEVTVHNSEMVVTGTYKTIGIDIDDDFKQVEITTDHEYLWNWRDMKWEK